MERAAVLWGNLFPHQYVFGLYWAWSRPFFWSRRCFYWSSVFLDQLVETWRTVAAQQGALHLKLPTILRSYGRKSSQLDQTECSKSFWDGALSSFPSPLWRRTCRRQEFHQRHVTLCRGLWLSDIWDVDALIKHPPFFRWHRHCCSVPVWRCADRRRRVLSSHSSNTVQDWFRVRGSHDIEATLKFALKFLEKCTNILGEEKENRNKL